MKCNRCKGESIILGKDMFGRAVAINCPICNKDGVAVRKETKEWGKWTFSKYFGQTLTGSWKIKI